MSIRLGSVQLKMMRVLWAKGEATAREITDELAGSEPIAHSTVQTLLRKLEAKGAVGHVQRERTFYFKPLIAENQVSKSAAHDLLSRVFQGSVVGLVANLLDNEDVSAEELANLKKLIEDKSKEQP